MSAIKRYQQTENYGTLGNFLRSHNIPNKFNIEKLINLNNNYTSWTKELNSILSSQTKPIKVYRGIQTNFQNELVNKSFTSSSTTIDAAARFTENAIFEFYIPMHIKTYIFKYKKNRANSLIEKEILIERNTKFINITNTFRTYKSIPIYSAELIKYYKPKEKEHNKILNNRRSVLTFFNSNNESSDFNN